MSLDAELAAQIERLRRSSPAFDDPDDGEELEEIRLANEEGLAAVRAERWARIVPAKFADATLADFAGRPFHDDVADWSRSPRGRNLVLLGPVGVGKTRLAIAACRDANDRGIDVRYYLTAEALDLLRPGGPDGALDALAHADRLILDDLGSERPTDWTAERLGILLDRRWRDERPTIVTTNLATAANDESNALLAAVGPRSYSRLVGDDALAIRLSGDDRRRTR